MVPNSNAAAPNLRWKDKLSRLWSSFQVTAGTHLRRTILNRPGHWAVVVLLIVAGRYFGDILESSSSLLHFRYRFYGFLHDLAPRHPYFRETVVLLIDDDVYWDGQPAGRVPFDRRYLSKLVKEVSRLHPSVIAIDFDLRSEDPSGKRLAESSAKYGRLRLPVDPQYVDETADFLEAVRDAARTCTVVLAKTVAWRGEGDIAYVAEANAYDGFDFKSANVISGYILLQLEDIRYVPRILRTTDGKFLDSFALACVRAHRLELLEAMPFEDQIFGSFIGAKEIEAATVRASTLFSHDVDRDKLERQLTGRIVLIGGAWHDRAHGRGNVIDTYDTPVGDLPGVFIHANYVESILDRRLFPAWSTTNYSDVLLGLLFAYVLILEVNTVIKCGLVFIGFVASIAVSYVLLQNFGVFWDVVVIDCLLICHALAERWLASLSSGSHA